MGKCAIINIGFKGFEPMSEDEFLSLKEGDEVTTYNGDIGIVLGLEIKAFAKIKLSTKTDYFGYWQLMKIKKN